MKIETTNFGTIEIEDNKVITFVDRILGFEEYSKFTIINDLENGVFSWLQSTEEASLAFLMVNPVDFVDDYKINIPEKFRKRLGVIEEEEEVIICTLVVVDEKSESIRTNLKAPIVINAKNKKAAQLVLDDDYPTKYYLLEKGNK